MIERVEKEGRNIKIFFFCNIELVRGLAYGDEKPYI